MDDMKFLGIEGFSKGESMCRILSGVAMFSDDFTEIGREQGEFERCDSFFAENWV